MGVQITELLQLEKLEFEDLKDKVVAIDASLFLYQFISTIRQADGTPLMDSKGNVTSHLSGLFFRTSQLLQKGIKPVYVFDGKAPELKAKERQRRADLKLEAEKKYKVAVEKEDISEMKKYAARTSRLTSEMVEESKELLKAMGLPIVQAPSEAEAQASHMVKKGDAYAVATQDADVLMFGTPRYVRNLSMIGKKKRTNQLAFQKIYPETVDLAANLNHLGIDQEQLIALCMIIGTDYNIGGIKRTGPKNGLKHVKKHGKDFESLFKELKWDEFFDYPWQDVFNLIQHIPVTNDYIVEFGDIDETMLSDLLAKKHDFGEERIISAIRKIREDKPDKQQKGLGDFF